MLERTFHVDHKKNETNNKEIEMLLSCKILICTFMKIIFTLPSIIKTRRMFMAGHLHTSGALGENERHDLLIKEAK